MFPLFQFVGLSLAVHGIVILLAKGMRTFRALQPKDPLKVAILKYYSLGVISVVGVIIASVGALVTAAAITDSHSNVRFLTSLFSTPPGDAPAQVLQASGQETAPPPVVIELEFDAMQTVTLPYAFAESEEHT